MKALFVIVFIGIAVFFAHRYYSTSGPLGPEVKRAKQESGSTKKVLPKESEPQIKAEPQKKEENKIPSNELMMAEIKKTYKKIYARTKKIHWAIENFTNVTITGLNLNPEMEKAHEKVIQDKNASYKAMIEAKDEFREVQTRYRSAGVRRLRTHATRERIGWRYTGEKADKVRSLKSLSGRDRSRRIRYIYKKELDPKEAQAKLKPEYDAAEKKMKNAEKLWLQAKTKYNQSRFEYLKHLKQEFSTNREAMKKLKSAYGKIKNGKENYKSVAEIIN